MVIDSSALIAILCDEPEPYDFNRKIEADSRRLISTASVLETTIVVESRYGEEAYRELDFFLMEIARRAYRQYGKGRHRASLNYGDCFSYALAKQTGEPLLFKGNDFSHTDVKALM
jgi:ribonuclease VapC